MNNTFNYVCCNQSLSNLKQSSIADTLAPIFPLDYTYCLCNDLVQQKSEDDQFSITLHVNIHTEEEANKWLNQFHLNTKTTMRVREKFKCEGTKVIYKKGYRCHHNTRPPGKKLHDKPSSKNTNCPAFLSFTIRNTNITRAKNVEHIKQFPMKIRLGFIHNHPIGSVEALRRRDVSEETERTFIEYFEQGFSPKLALEAYKCHLRMEFGERYDEVACDRAFLPEIQWCYRLYYKHVKPEDRVKRNYLSLDIPKKTLTVPSTEDVKEDLQELSNAFDCLARKITAKMHTEAVVDFRPAVQTFIRNVSSINTDSCLLKSLYNFADKSTKTLKRKNDNSNTDLGIKYVKVQDSLIVDHDYTES
ncbi:uncharacterized protein [Antedon mediterranea]|uniref:uncharacterized protein n=1 Tax=Antedon mediterranea TaxID=105859 RepID=UPI003AF8273D